MTTRGSTMGRMASKSFILNEPLGCTLSDLNVPEFNRAQSASVPSNIMSVIKLPVKNNTQLSLKLNIKPTTDLSSNIFKFCCKFGSSGKRNPKMSTQA